MADKRLDQITKVTDMAYVPVIMADGSLGQIAKADLASVVAESLGYDSLSKKTNRRTIDLFDSRLTLIRLCKDSAMYALIKVIFLNDVGGYIVSYVYPFQNGTYTNPLKKEVVHVDATNTVSIKYYYDGEYVYILIDRYTYGSRLYISVESNDIDIIDGTKMSSTDVSNMTEF